MEVRLQPFKERISYQIILLSSACALAALLLFVTNWATKPIISQRILEDQNALLREVLAGQPYSNDVFSNRQLIEYEGKSFELYRVEDENQQLINWVIRGEQEGYSGTIRFLIGLKISGEIIGVRIISHSETPGLGDKIEAEKSSWILSFAKRTLENTGVWAVQKDGGDFDQFSGATITPRAVVKGVHQALLALESYQGANNE
ncbi:RnfABCDGE type electron transport complex subunit G [Vibrio natriegens]|jgi:electron transport complex protein RnfG|uniref:RnfABCDGE type electron transport complex subunit G n=1 Tax=Vibrio natriegens TaxID=691 RepID=UPI000803F814|nr:RnfABCDGE type electron transport complex subunit G [Vibrio natriegens]ANQ19234.1 electron transport complex subunit G [Vibrio natriegens]